MSIWGWRGRREVILGWDLGGAHIKAAGLDENGCVTGVVQQPCPLWQGLDQLQLAVEKVMQRLAPGPRRHFVTMTGELVDLFQDRASGVRHLLSVMASKIPADSLRVYAGTRDFLTREQAEHEFSQVASANWRASVALTAERLAEGILIDVGSTTTDLAPFKEREALTMGYDDHQRLLFEELVYTGVVRTPLMALARRAPFAGQWVSLMAEHFATTADVYRLTGDLPEHADMLPSADHGAKNVAASARRLARMLGLDMEAADLQGWRRVADFLAQQQLRTLEDALQRILSRSLLGNGAPLVGAGCGRFLVRRLAHRLERPYVGFDELFDCEESKAATAAECAPAVAVAVLGAASGEGA